MSQALARFLAGLATDPKKNAAFQANAEEAMCAEGLSEEDMAAVKSRDTAALAARLGHAVGIFPPPGTNVAPYFAANLGWKWSPPSPLASDQGGAAPPAQGVVCLPVVCLPVVCLPVVCLPVMVPTPVAMPPQSPGYGVAVYGLITRRGLRAMGSPVTARRARKRRRPLIRAAGTRPPNPPPPRRASRGSGFETGPRRARRGGRDCCVPGRVGLGREIGGGAHVGRRWCPARVVARRRDGDSGLRPDDDRGHRGDARR